MLAHPDGGGRWRRRCRAGVDKELDGLLRAARARVPSVLDRLAREGWRFVADADEEYPAGLAALADPPLGLFVKGRLPDRTGAAIVGARRATAYGREVAEHLGRELGAAGVWVVSGMARGVDGAAHRGALAAGGPTLAVWGTGPDRVYPPEHARLAAEIGCSGGIVTEYPPDTPPRPSHFPERNRLIAGLARVIVVVEADERSGALVTARLALEEGREVMAVPGSIFSRLSAGPNGLLRAGAAPVLSARDVLDVLGVAAGPATPAAEEPGLLAAIPRGQALTPDALAALTAQPIGAVLRALLELELGGRVVREADGRYRRCQARSSS